LTGLSFGEVYPLRKIFGSQEKTGQARNPICSYYFWRTGYSKSDSAHASFFGKNQPDLIKKVVLEAVQKLRFDY